MKRSIFLFVMVAILSLGMIVYGCVFTSGRVSAVALTEETVVGNKVATDGLTVGFRADAGEDLHWINSYDYSTGETESVFKRGETLEAEETSVFDDVRRDRTFVGTMLKTVKTSLYDDIRFTGWDTEPFTTKLEDDRLQGLQDKGIHGFYDSIQQRVQENGQVETGKLRLKDYVDYYPVSFHFRLGSNRYDSGNALAGLKLYEAQGESSSEDIAVYDEDVALYTAFNAMFKIPVIDNEYQEYRVSGMEDHDLQTALGYETDIEKPLGAGEDYYEFDPIMALQEESAGDGGSRILFIVNNRTAKGAAVDVSQIIGGYGVYELPIEVGTKAVKIGHRVVTVPDPKPLPDRLAMVYPLDAAAEYVEMSLSKDHRYVAVFSVKNGSYFVDMIDAVDWYSEGPVALFPASEQMTYAWGEDGSLAATNHRGDIAVFCRADEGGTSKGEEAYPLIYSGNVGKAFCDTFFDGEMVYKKNSYAAYQYGIDEGLAIAAKDGKLALVQDQLVHLSDTTLRNAALECAVIDETGVIYQGRLHSPIVDLEDDETSAEKQVIEAILNDGAASKAAAHILRPAREQNRAAWQ